MSDSSDAPRAQIDTSAVIALVITLLPWASAFAGIRVGLEGYSPGALVLFRFLVASSWADSLCTDLSYAFACSTRSASNVFTRLPWHYRLPGLPDLW